MKKRLTGMISWMLVICMMMSFMAMPAAAVTGTADTSKDKTAQWHDDSQTIADVTLSVPGENVDVSSDIVFIIGHGPASNYTYIVDMIHKMLVAADGTPTKIKIGMVGYADTTEDETVLPLTEMKDTVPGNTVADYRFANKGSSESAEDYAARKAEYEAKIAGLLEETPALADDMEFIIARALEKAEAVYRGINMESALITARDMLVADETVPAERKHMIAISTGLTYWFDNDDGKGSFIVRANHGGENPQPQHADYTRWLEARHPGTSTTDYGYKIPSAYINGAESTTDAWHDYWNDIVSWIEKDQNKYVYSVRDTYTAFTGRLSKRLIVNAEDLALVQKDENGKYVLAPYVANGNPKTDAKAQHAIAYERAQYEALLIYRQMETPIGQSVTSVLKDKDGKNITFPGLGFNCYAIANGKGSNPGEEDLWMESDQIGYNFMHMLGGENTVNYRDADTSFFKSIENKVLVSCGAGSYVEDYIGYKDSETDGFNFDFLVDGKITLTVGATEYTTAKLETPNTDATASYTFTAPGAETATFTLDYFAGDLKEGEYFKWTFDEAIQNFAPAKLNYQVELVECRMPEGTAANGYIVETNRVATLHPNGSDEGEEFPIPKLTVLPMYTVTYEYVGVIPENAPAVPAAKDYLAGTAVSVATAPALEGYIFYGWNDPCNSLEGGIMPAHDVTLSGYWLPVNDHVDPPIGIKTDKETTNDYEYEVTISVPGDGETVKVHDEIILVLDGSYSVDKEWPKMKENIIQIGQKVLGGAGRTQMTIIAFGMGDNIFAEGIKTVDELKAKLENMPLPGYLLFGRSSTNCEVGFTSAMKYIESKKNELSKVDVIYISDFGVNTDETPDLFHFSQTPWKKTFSLAGSLVGALEAEIEVMKYAEEINASAAFTEVFGENADLDALMTELNTIVLKRHSSWKIPTSVNEESELYKKVWAWADKVYNDVFKEAGLDITEEHPISVVERAFVTYDNTHSTYIQEAFYYATMGRGYSDMYNRTDVAAEKLAAMELVNELYLIRYGNHGRGWWAKDVVGAKYYSAASVADLSTVITPLATELSQTNYTDVVITDYMSKWVNLDLDSIYIMNDTTGEIIWTIKDGWKSDTDRPTSKTPVTWEVVTDNKYIADDGVTEEINKNGVLYKLTWNVKDDCLLRTDNYSLHYLVTVDTEEPGFVAGVEYPANGHTYVDYEVGGHNDIKVPDVTIPAYTVTYLNGEIELQKTDAHMTGDAIPGCFKPADYVEGNTAYTFSGWRLISGTEGADNTVGTTDLVYQAVYTSKTTEPEEEITEPSVPLAPTPSEPETSEPTVPSEPEEEIPDEDVPLAPNPNESPKTGDNTNLMGAIIAAMASISMAVLVLSKKKNFFN